jgi:hypothetical protein
MKTILSAIRLAIPLYLHRRQHRNNSLLNQNIFFYLGRYDFDRFMACSRNYLGNFTIVCIELACVRMPRRSLQLATKTV